MTRHTDDVSFLSRFPQKDIELPGFKAKSPLFYRDAALMGGIFTADAAYLRTCLPNANFAPFELNRGRGLIGIHCMKYKDSDIGPYNEVALTILTDYGSTSRSSGLRFASALFTKCYRSYVLDLPVSTEVALVGGRVVFNYPKYRADISFRETARHRICTVRDPESMELIIEFAGRKLTPGRLQGVVDRLPGRWREVDFQSYPVVGGKVVRARSLLRFREVAVTAALPSASLRCGSHPRAEPYRRLAIGSLLQYTYAPRYEAVLFEPEDIDAASQERGGDRRRGRGFDGSVSAEQAP